ncbi:MAG TPA: hypothetical protein VMN58_04100 [Acidimicrobiales bacterium]|nr:hypothetical protein [Acidimicrobiales bacterium]
MSNDKTPLDRALDVVLFAPVGLALAARELLPDLADRGRQQLTNQATMAKMVGQFAVQQGQVQATKALDDARHQAATALEQLGLLGDASSSNGSSATTATAPATTAPAPAAPAPSPTPTSGPGAAALAIPDYDSLSASQVVPRLSGLGATELEAVRAYEGAHRGRKTILNKVAQLQAGA